MATNHSLDVVVTVPRGLWVPWLDEGDAPGASWSGYDSHFWVSPQNLPALEPGARVYIVAHGKLRGYAPLVKIERSCTLAPNRACFLRRGGAVAVTLKNPYGPGPLVVGGFRGWRWRWWYRGLEVPFPAWRMP